MTERFPNLKVVFAEAGIGGLNYVIAACDHEWECRQLWNEGLPTRPSEAVRRQMARLADEQRAVEAAQAAIRQRDANGLAMSLGKLVELRPVWTDRVDAGDVVRLLGIEQIEQRLIRLLAGGTLETSDQWMVDLVIAAGRLPEVTRIARLTPRDVDRMIHRSIEEA